MSAVEALRQWEREVRDPAKAAALPEVVIKCGRVAVDYQLAELPDGRWAWTAGYSLGMAGGGTPWSAVEDHRDALLAVRRYLLASLVPRDGDDPVRGLATVVRRVERQLVDL